MLIDQKMAKLDQKKAGRQNRNEPRREIAEAGSWKDQQRDWSGSSPMSNQKIRVCDGKRDSLCQPAEGGRRCNIGSNASVSKSPEESLWLYLPRLWLYERRGRDRCRFAVSRTSRRRVMHHADLRHSYLLYLHLWLRGGCQREVGHGGAWMPKSKLHAGR